MRKFNGPMPIDRSCSRTMQGHQWSVAGKLSKSAGRESVIVDARPGGIRTQVVGQFVGEVSIPTRSG